MTPPLFGVVGWKNSGKTTLMARLIEELTRRGYAVSVIKHAHEKFEIDHPGRDSFKLREAGAAEDVRARALPGPEPAHLWAAHEPTRIRSPRHLWVDASARGLGACAQRWLGRTEGRRC